MDEKIVKLLFDIKMAISEIDSFLSEKPVTIAYYRNNQQLKRAVERDLEIIGEAVSKILSMERNFPLENARKITGLRNQIIHAYDNISDEMIWSIVINHLPRLNREVDELLKSNS